MYRIRSGAVVSGGRPNVSQRSRRLDKAPWKAQTADSVEPTESPARLQPSPCKMLVAAVMDGSLNSKAGWPK